MVVKTTAEAWEAANKMLPTDYQKDEESSQRAGYPIYRSTAVDHYNFYICDLNDRLEVNMNGESVNIWIQPEPEGMEVKVFLKDGHMVKYSKPEQPTVNFVNNGHIKFYNISVYGGKFTTSYRIEDIEKISIGE